MLRVVLVVLGLATAQGKVIIVQNVYFQVQSGATSSKCSVENLDKFAKRIQHASMNRVARVVFKVVCYVLVLVPFILQVLMISL